MEMAQKAPEKVQAIIDKNKKIDILVAFNTAYPDAIVSFPEKKKAEIEPIIEDVEVILAKEAELKAIAEADKLADEKAAKKAELEAELKALDES